MNMDEKSETILKFFIEYMKKAEDTQSNELGLNCLHENDINVVRAWYVFDVEKTPVQDKTSCLIVTEPHLFTVKENNPWVTGDAVYVIPEKNLYYVVMNAGMYDEPKYFVRLYEKDDNGNFIFTNLWDNEEKLNRMQARPQMLEKLFKYLSSVDEIVSTMSNADFENNYFMLCPH